MRCNMGKIAIVTDSNSGIGKDAPEGVFVVPMPFLINDEDYFENINLSQEEFYKYSMKTLKETIL